jgi:hypothetical protein
LDAGLSYNCSALEAGVGILLNSTSQTDE